MKREKNKIIGIALAVIIVDGNMECAVGAISEETTDQVLVAGR